MENAYYSLLFSSENVIFPPALKKLKLKIQKALSTVYMRVLRKATGSYRTYSIPDKTAAFVPEFVVEHLPSAELLPRFLRLQ